MALINPGTRAPNFTLADQHGEKHTLKKYKGRPVVVYFYPKDDTSVCTVQACQFRDHHPDFSKIDAVVLGISPDDEASHAAFVEKHGLNFPLLADTGRDASGKPTVCDAWGVWGEKSMYGRKYMGVVRTTYLLDQKGVVTRRWDNVKVTGHIPDVLATVKMLLGMAPEKASKASKKRASETKARRSTRTRGGTVKKAAGRGNKGRGVSAKKVGGKGKAK